MENGMERIAGLLFSGLVVRLVGVAVALYIGAEVAAYVSDVFGSVSTALDAALN